MVLGKRWNYGKRIKISQNNPKPQNKFLDNNGCEAAIEDDRNTSQLKSDLPEMRSTNKLFRTIRDGQTNYDSRERRNQTIP